MQIGTTARRIAAELVVIGPALAVDLVAWQEIHVLRDGRAFPVWVIPALSVIVYSSLVLRRRSPITVFVIQWTYCGLLAWAVPLYEPIANLLVALYAVSSRLGVRRSGIAFALCVVPLGVESLAAAAVPGRSGFAANFGFAMVIFLALAACAWGLGRLRRRADDKTRRALEQQDEVAATAVREERLRLARELHDIVAHAVTAIILQAAGARRMAATDAGEVDRALEVIEAAGVRAMHELHRLLDLLRSDDQDDRDRRDDRDKTAALRPGLENLPELVQFSRSAGMDVEHTVRGRAIPLDRSVDLAAYRVIQESLTNAGKHNAAPVTVRIGCLWSDDRLTVSVRSTLDAGEPRADPVAFSSKKGLIGLRERVRLVGGALTVGPDDHEFVVVAELPAGVAGQVVGEQRKGTR